MYEALAVSQRIINYSHKKEYSISNCKLQGLLYYVQSFFLMEIGKPCFKEQIEAWGFGVIIPEVYQEFKMYGLCELPEIDCYPILFNKATHKKMIHEVVDYFADYAASDLMRLIINQEPWINCYKPYKKNIITIKDLYNYFGNNKLEEKNKKEEENEIMKPKKIDFKSDFIKTIENINRILKEKGHSICLVFGSSIGENLSDTVSIKIDDKFVQTISSIILTPEFYAFLEQSLANCGYNNIFYNNTKTTFFVKL